ncbi:MAG TPA: hypothetical protein VJV79_21290 [Polyangiaceae bacterium]|nr:hypothetical protein [Polyangiaceae bacterium]
MSKKVEPLSDHPLFRALVLMGGGLAVGCGGVAERETPLSTDIGGSGSASGGPVSSTAGGSPSIGLPVAGAPSAAAGANAATAYAPACPYEQWDCSALLATGACFLSLLSKDDPLAAGCSCDTSRPKSAAACKLDESFVCRQAYPPYVEGQARPSTWDGNLHVQCACLPTPKPGTDNCTETCTKEFSVTQWPPMQCFVSNSKCDDNGVCTATSADVLRQDGIMCGCAAIALK